MENDEVATAEIPLPKEQERRQLEWTTEMKVTLIIFDNEERAKGRGFMKRVKERWDQYYSEYRDASWQKLSNNAARFKKDSEVINLILVEGETRYRKKRPDMRKIYKRRTTKQGTISTVMILIIML